MVSSRLSTAFVEPTFLLRLQSDARSSFLVTFAGLCNGICVFVVNSIQSPKTPGGYMRGLKPSLVLGMIGFCNHLRSDERQLALP